MRYDKTSEWLRFLLKIIGARQCAYRRNLGNTILTVSLAVPFLTLLYAFLWFPDLNKTVSRLSQDIVVSIFTSAFISVA